MNDKALTKMPLISLRTIARRKPYFAPGLTSATWDSFKTRGATPGLDVAALEKKLQETLHLSNAVVVASGRLGLRLLLKTSGLERGSEILLPGYTFGLLYPAVTAAGFVPAPVDIDPGTFQMDPARAQEAINSRTGAVLATHLFGEPCDLTALADVARRHDLLLIEDCAQALGATRDGAPVGTTGDAGLASFDLSKPLQGIRGGVVFGRDADWMARVRESLQDARKQGNALKEIISGYAQTALVGSPLWRVPMLLFSYEATQRLLVRIYRRSESESANVAPGVTSEIDVAALPDPLARMVSLNLESLDKRLARRREIRAMYHDLLGDLVQFQRILPSDKGTCHMVTARVSEDVFRLRRYLALRGIDVGAGDETADDCLRKKGSVVETVFRETISLPIHYYLTDSDVRRIAATLRAGLARQRA